HILCTTKADQSEQASQEISLRFCFSSAYRCWQRWLGLITQMRFGHKTSSEYSQLPQRLKTGLSALLARGCHRTPGKFSLIESFPICWEEVQFYYFRYWEFVSPAIDYFPS